MENINRVVEMTIEGLKTEKVIVRAGRCVGPFSEILATFSEILVTFDHEAGVTSVSGTTSSETKPKLDFITAKIAK